MSDESDKLRQLNPCIVTGISPVADELVADQVWRSSIDTEDPLQVRNLARIREKYERAKAILRNAGYEAVIPYMTFSLKPEFSDEPAALGDSKIGGIPDFRKYAYLGDDHTQIEAVWPKCGCCHVPMTFVGQFDLLPWLLPLHAAFSLPELPAWLGYRRATLGKQAYVSAIGNTNMVEHVSVKQKVLWQLFVCPQAGHFREHGADAVVLITERFKSEVDTAPLSAEAGAAWEATVRMFASTRSHTVWTPGDAVEHEDEPENYFAISPRKIEGFDIRFALESFDLSVVDGRDNYYDAYDLLKAHPDVFSYFDKFSLFGAPYSQQEPQRFFSPFGLRVDRNAVPRRMTPFLRFDDEKQDMSYQVQLDTANSGGYIVYGKVDASCT